METQTHNRASRQYVEEAKRRAGRTPTCAEHPLVRQLSDIMEASNVGRRRASVEGGLARRTVEFWLTKGAVPGVSAFEDALNAVGYRLNVYCVGKPDAALKKMANSGQVQRTENADSHWLVKAARQACDREGLSQRRSAASAGVKWSTARAWWRLAQLNHPSLYAIEAWLRVLGMELVIEPIAEAH